jgi:hypothetical protein
MFAVACLAPAAFGDIVTNASAVDWSTALFSPSKLVNGITAEDGWLNDWRTPGDPNPYITADVTGDGNNTALALASVKLYANIDSVWAASRVEVLYSADLVPVGSASFTSLGVFDVSTANATPTTIPLSVTAQYVKFVIKKHSDGTDYPPGPSAFVGLAEAEFNTIPEPATLGLLAAGLVGMVLRRRK